MFYRGGRIKHELEFTGRTIPEDVLNPYSLSAESMVAANGDLSPAIFAISKSSGDIYLFEVLISQYIWSQWHLRQNVLQTKLVLFHR